MAIKYISRDFLKAHEDRHLKLPSALLRKFTGRHDNAPKVFVSHSSLDKDIVLQVVNMLHATGLRCYVDWLDAGLPNPPDVGTAAQLKAKIEECDRFLVVSTLNSDGSVWVPWELGLADGRVDTANIAVLRVGAQPTAGEENLFMSLYNVVLLEDLEPIVVRAAQKTASLKDWIAKGN